jgi:ATP-dependent RNA helicase RhlE
VLKHLPAKRQTLFFSATMPAPIITLTRELLHNPATINLERKSAPAIGIRQAVYAVREELKPALFVELMRRGDIGNVIVFTRTKHRANRLADYLTTEGIPNAKIHGNRSQAQRTEALEGFKTGRYRCLVATDIVARGIDVEQLEHVVNFDVPHIPEDYIHRVGRTARADATGDAFTFVSPEEETDLSAIERSISKRLPRVIVSGFDYATKPKQRFEVPIAERIADIRARKSEERKRAKEKADRRAGHGAGPAASSRSGSSRSGSSAPSRPSRPASSGDSRSPAGASGAPSRRGSGRKRGGPTGGGRPGGGAPTGGGPYR